MTVQTHANAERAVAAATDRICAFVAAHSECRLILPAGKTPVPLYREMLKRIQSGELSLARTALFQLDEYLGVGPEDQRSFQAQLHRDLLDHVDQRPASVHFLDGSAADAGPHVQAHGEAFEGTPGPALAVLGLGVNGHVAFNEPGSTLDHGARLVDLDATTVSGARAVFDDRQVPTRGMTLGLRELAGAEEILILVLGASKASILQRTLETPTSDCPASLLTPLPQCTVIADNDAVDGRAQDASA